MGLTKSKESYEEEQAAKEKREKTYDVRKIYWDGYGNLRVGTKRIRILMLPARDALLARWLTVPFLTICNRLD